MIFITSHPLQVLAIQPVGAPQQPEGPYSPNVLLVKFKPQYRAKINDNTTSNTGVTNINRVLSRHHAESFKKVAHAGKKSKTSAEVFGWYEVGLDPNRPVTAVQENGKTVYPDLEQLQNQLEADPSVEAVSKDYQVKATLVPNDPFYSSSGSWGQGYGDMWGLQKINAATAWDTTTGSSSVVAAVIDSGVDRTHPDISSNIWSNPGETGTTQAGDRCWTGTPQNKSTNNCDDDNNGYIDDVYGWNWVSTNNNTLDDYGHGTHVAGTIAASTNNGVGVAGISWSTKIMSLKFLNSNGTGNLSDAVSALQYAADMGAKVTNNSWGCSCNSSIVDDAVKYEHDRNVTTVVAAGNDSSDALNDNPANSDGAITVGATDSNDAIASFSNTGPRVDVTAPGVDILSLKSSLDSSVCTGAAIVSTNYCHISGTSMATPHVTGLISLMLAVNPSLKPEQIRQILHTTTQDLGTAGRDNTFGWGRIKADSAVSAASSANVLTPFISSPTSRSTISGTVTFNGDADGTNFSSYKLEIGAGRTPSSWTTVTTSSSPVDAGVLASFNTLSVQDGSYTFRLTATNASSQTFEYKIFDINVDNFDASVLSPLNIVSFNSSIPIIGTAVTKNGLGFSGYTVDYGLGTSPSSWSTTGITLTNGGNSPVSASTLATWNTTGLTNAQTYTLRITITAVGGTTSSTTTTIVPDSSLVSGWPKYIPGTNCTAFCFGAGEVFADLDGDGQKEVIIPAATNKIYAFHKDGTAVSGWPVTVTSGDYFDRQPVVADLDGDLKPKIILSANIGSTNSQRIYIIKSDGTLYPGWPEPVVNVDSPGDDATPSVADLDGDGQKEIIYYDYNQTIANRTALHAVHLSGSEAAGFPKQIFGAAGPWLNMPPTVADIDKDGHPEIILPWYNEIFTYDYQGNPKPGWPVTLPDYNFTVETIQGPPAVGDVNGDGKLEVIANANPNGALFNGNYPVYAYSYTGSLLVGWPYISSTTLLTSGVDLNSPLTADIDGDGKDEVFGGTFGPAIIDDGTGPRSHSFFAGQTPPSIADFNGDSNYKFPGMYSHGIHWGNMDFSIFWSNDNLNNLSTENPSNSTIVVGDLDHNNKLEFAASVKHNSELDAYLWEMPGNTKPLDNWPMFGHDPAHTGHFTVGQETTDNIPPQVALTSPSNSSSVSGFVPITATAIDETAISKVEFYVDGNLVGTDTSFPYTASWDSSGATIGAHTVMAKAYDTSNNTATNSVSVTVPDTAPPSVNLTAPTNGAQLRSDTTVTANASDNVGVSSVAFYIDGSLIGSDSSAPYQLQWSSTAATVGQHTVKATASDAAGNTASDQIIVTVIKRGDVNNDGLVNISDLSIMLSNWGNTYAAADFNNNGIVDISDLSILLSHYGQ